MLNALSTDIAVPRSLDEALSLPQGDKCKTSLHPIGCKITVKRDKDGNFHCFKSRLVAKVCSQRWGINYSETFSPVSRYSTIRLVIALEVKHGMYIHQMDVSSAYLNGDLHDVVYMRQHEGFINEQNPQRVLRLHKNYMA